MSLWSGQFIGTLLYGVTPGEPFVVAAAVAMLVIVGTIAAWLPAHRASLTDPAIVLRHDS
jgi:putative ABC transport system permease protein